MSSFNAIWIGYPFAQDFETDPGAIPAGAGLWLTLRDASGRREQCCPRIDLTRLSPTSWRLSLTQQQTALLRPGAVSGDLRLQIGNTAQPLGLRITIPVELAQ